MGTGPGGRGGISLLSPTHCFAQMGIIIINVQPTHPPHPGLGFYLSKIVFPSLFYLVKNFGKVCPSSHTQFQIASDAFVKQGLLYINISMNFLAV